MGRRFRFLVRPPERLDLWQEYVALRDQDMRSGDGLGGRFGATDTDDPERSPRLLPCCIVGEEA